jgi:hypothetical protein
MSNKLKKRRKEIESKLNWETRIDEFVDRQKWVGKPLAEIARYLTKKCI